MVVTWIDPYFEPGVSKPETRRDMVTILKERCMTTLVWNPATVGWSSPGPVSPGEVTKFVEALTWAAGYAEGLDQKYKGLNETNQ